FVMSSASTVTYTSVYTDFEPGRVFWGAHPPSLDYVPGPKHLPSPAEPLPADASPIALSSGYVADSDPEEDPEEDHADYPADGGDDDDEPSDDDDDDDDTDDEDEEPFEDEDDDKEEEHLALADSSAVPVVDLVPSAGDTEAFKTDESAPTPLPSPRRHIARISIPSPPLPPPPSSLHLPPYVPTSLPLPSSPLPPLLASLFIPLPVDRREDIPEAKLPSHKRLCLTALTSRAEEVGYGIRDVWVDPTEVVEEVAPPTLEGVNTRVTELAAVQEQDKQDIYALIEDTQDRQTQLFQRVDGLDYRIASQESLVMTLIAHVSSLHGQLSATLGQIQALQARASTAVGLVFSFLVSDNHNNMPPRRSSATARAAAAAARVVAAAAAATPMTAAAVEQLIEERVCLIMKLFEIALMVRATEATILTLELAKQYALRVSVHTRIF
ncbi:hypothetical protein Tco_1440840, partial [Tanacetum coccineum]